VGRPLVPLEASIGAFVGASFSVFELPAGVLVGRTDGMVEGVLVGPGVGSEDGSMLVSIDGLVDGTVASPADGPLDGTLLGPAVGFTLPEVPPPSPHSQARAITY
jgi:hypothetical protein